MESIQTQKNTQKLLHQNYRFTSEKYVVQGKIIWRCENRTCKARMHTLGDQVLKEPGNTTHVRAGRKERTPRRWKHRDGGGGSTRTEEAAWNPPLSRLLLPWDVSEERRLRGLSFRGT
ncbi:unnamed protein product [Darwinula stevensoni]|uniref:FLYWCH-type domain-containing protein n=1 Tax=Darwinula stevensoni TaxID=69355 RepID=A0A7R9FSN3_9CRUS|nr:unnamed protein product [Darwinula stevensoni]CAG0903842.1 unnamed protein product [Darwinula stevensoni]